MDLPPVTNWVACLTEMTTAHLTRQRVHYYTLPHEGSKTMTDNVFHIPRDVVLRSGNWMYEKSPLLAIRYWHDSKSRVLLPKHRGQIIRDDALLNKAVLEQCEDGLFWEEE